MGWPQITIIAFAAASFGIAAAKEGEPKGNFSCISSGIFISLELWILWCGGFFA